MQKLSHTSAKIASPCALCISFSMPKPSRPSAKTFKQT